MSRDEFNIGAKDIELNYRQVKNNLELNYMIANARAKVGDKLTDIWGESIIVKRVAFESRFPDVPVITYHGYVCTIQGVLVGNDLEEKFHECNIRSINSR